jgi:NhaP-type Na+/H+ and K+/H+ antiporter
VDNAYLIAALWMGLALLASVISIRVGISVALVEIAIGVVGGNFLGLHTNTWIDFLAGFGAVLLTFLAGAEIDPDSFRRTCGPAWQSAHQLRRAFRSGLPGRPPRPRLGTPRFRDPALRYRPPLSRSCMRS